MTKKKIVVEFTEDDIAILLSALGRYAFSTDSMKAKRNVDFVMNRIYKAYGVDLKG